MKDCKVVVGGAGFLGSHLVNLLCESGDDVLVIDNLVVGRREWVHPKARFEWHDITGSEARLRGILRSFGATQVFNLAAIPFIPDSYGRPAHVFDVNVLGALKVINAAQDARVDRILQVSSSEVYGNTDFDPDVGITEDCQLNPCSTYGVSKAAIDQLARIRAVEWQTPVVVIRQFNCIGERESHPYLIPELIRQFCDSPSEEVPTITIGTNTKRDYTYAGDAAWAMSELIGKGKAGEAYNFGSGTSYLGSQAAVFLGKQMGFKGITLRTDSVTKKRPADIDHLKSCNAKILGVVGNKCPNTSFQDALAKTVEWHRREHHS